MAGYVYSGPGYAADVAAGKVQAKSPGMSGSSSGPSSSGSSQTIVTGSGNMKNGTRSSDVTSLQQRLNELGYGLATDGIYGAKTEAAVRDYQSKNGLSVDGIVGNNTRGALNAVSGSAAGAQANQMLFGPNEEEEEDSYGRYYDEISDLMDELRGMYSGNNSAYDEALAAQKAATAAGIQKAKNDLTAQKDTVAQSYADANRQLYLDKMKSQKNIAQQMAAMGQTGGQAESTLLGLDTSYADALRKNGQAQENAISALDKAIVDAELSGSASDASATAENAINKANSYAATLQNLIGVYGNIAQAEQAQANADREYNYNLAMALIGNGQIPSDDVLYSAGISKDNAAAIIAQNAAQPVAKNSGSGGGRSGGSNGGNTIDAIWTSFKYGDRSPETIKALEDYYGIPIATLAAREGVEYTDEAETEQNASTKANSSSGEFMAPYSNEYIQRKNNVPAIEVTADIYQRTQGNVAAREYVKKAYNGSEQLLNYEDYSRLLKKYSM